jgi:hypothetical protein
LHALACGAGDAQALRVSLAAMHAEQLPLRETLFLLDNSSTFEPVLVNHRVWLPENKKRVLVFT